MPEEKRHKKRLPIKYISIGAMLLVVAGIILYFQFVGMARTVKAGDLVAVNYVGTLDDGRLFDTSLKSVATENNMLDPQRAYEPLQFTVGGGQMIKGFDNVVVGMRAGETKTIILQPEDAYGNVRQDLIASINASTIQTNQDNLTVGGRIVSSNGLSGVVTKLENGNATIDFNNPLAGKVLHFKIMLVKILK